MTSCAERALNWEAHAAPAEGPGMGSDFLRTVSDILPRWQLSVGELVLRMFQ